jgi:hypothetical protein
MFCSLLNQSQSVSITRTGEKEREVIDFKLKENAEDKNCQDSDRVVDRVWGKSIIKDPRPLLSSQALCKGSMKLPNVYGNW